MKKSRMIALTLVVAIMLLGAGYAAWSDTLTITSTVKTGKLDVNMLQDGASVVVQQSTGVAESETIGRTKTIAVGDDVATVNVDNLYPGAVVVVTIPVKNDSTIPVIASGEVIPTGDANYTVTGLDFVNLAAGEQRNLVYRITVNPNAGMNASATFDASVIYKQFNQ